MKNKRTGIAIVFLMIVLALGMMFLIPIAVDGYKENKKAKIMKDLENIYMSAIIVDKIDGGLHNDSDNAGKYEILSKDSGFDVYNVPKKGKYSLMKDYKTEKITVYYGTDIQYPAKIEKEEGPIKDGDVSIEDLFMYDESNGNVVITGFSGTAINLLKSDSVIEIPSSYNGREVKEIADKAFYNKNIMGTVIIPESIKKVGSHAFSNNGEKGISGNITKPYAGTWKVDGKNWVRIK